MMFARRVIFCLLIVVIALTRAGWCGDAVRLFGLEIFKSQVGHWVGTDILMNNANGETVRLSGYYDAAFVLDGAFFCAEGAVSDGKKPFAYKWLYAFHATETKYRAWQFTSSGFVTEYIGTYNAEQRELTLKQTSKDPGPRWVTVVRFGEDMVSIVATGRAAEGAIILTGKSTYRRAKDKRSE